MDPSRLTMTRSWSLVRAIAAVSTQDFDLASKIWDFGCPGVTGDDELDFRIGLSSGKDQSIRHPQDFPLRTKFLGPVRHLEVNRDNPEDQLVEKAANATFVVMTQPCAGENLVVRGNT